VAHPIALLIALGSPYHTATERQRIGNQIDAAFIFAGSDFGQVAHRIIVKEVSQTPPPPPIISVTHVRADENER
jgi:hypothetical protein